MTYLEIRQEVQNNLGRTDTETTNYINTAINQILTEDLPRYKPEIYKRISTLSTTAAQEYILLSSLTNLHSFADQGVTVEDGSDYVEIYPMVIEKEHISDTGKPTHYTVRWVSDVAYMYLRPVPDDAYSMKLWYYVKDTALSDDTDEASISTIYGDGPLIAGATMLTAEKLSIWDVYEIFKRRYEREEIPKLLNWQDWLEGQEKDIGNLYL